jgi:hypothetical protein
MSRRLPQDMTTLYFSRVTAVCGAWVNRRQPETPQML